MAEHAHNPTQAPSLSILISSFFPYFHSQSIMSRRKLHFNKVTLTLSCSCIKPRLSDIFHPKPKPKPNPTKSPASVGGHRFGRGDGLAVEKDSDDPYLDFKQSMLQMIVENEMYSKDDLRELLNCFLQLNSPYHHGVIIRAFTEIWNGVFFVKPGSKRAGRKTRPETHHN